MPIEGATQSEVFCPAYSHDPKTLVPPCDLCPVESIITNLRHRPFLGSDCFNLLRIHALAGSPSHFDSSDAGDTYPKNQQGYMPAV
ncbi:hypothetical protein TWF970_006127 [Orbilia oligospora]|uniref:Uncharacterized protein n=1 Tax=Orbilia oligospora TaxID=2813651 RepID=A0A7C8VC19_ORBOL|nr:hypothetical protein TWF970_006127 [Orbilia oligospora]